MSGIRNVVLFVLAGTVAILWLNDWPWISNTSMDYSGVCSVSTSAYSHCPKWLELSQPISVKVVSDQNMVIVRSEGSPAKTFTNCKIKDGKNWVCTVDRNNVIRMVDGEQILTVNSTEVSMPKWRWLWLQYVNSVPVRRIGQPLSTDNRQSNGVPYESTIDADVLAMRACLDKMCPMRELRDTVDGRQRVAVEQVFRPIGPVSMSESGNFYSRYYALPEGMNKYFGALWVSYRPASKDPSIHVVTFVGAGLPVP